MDVSSHLVAEPTPRQLAARPYVRAWLICLALLVVVMVVVGGATRLTGSGLSITEWQPVAGVVPPTSEAAWLEEFDKYRQIPQYTQVNRGMSLDEFKVIYWWEWGHRFLGRLVGVVFLVPFIWFYATGRLESRLLPWLVGAFLLGGAQGVLGWYMVASGLVERVAVSHYRLAAHLTLAAVIFAYLLWLAETLRARPVLPALPARLPATAVILLVLLVVQIAVGALVAGLDAGLVYTTWPLMDGRIVPQGILSMMPWWMNLFENVATVQFMHRVVAYAILALAVFHALDCTRQAGEGPVTTRAWLIVILVVAQAVIGIATLLMQVPLALALVHQSGAIVVLAAVVIHITTMAPMGSPMRRCAEAP